VLTAIGFASLTVFTVKAAFSFCNKQSKMFAKLVKEMK